jgi:hypothetical protein
MPLEQGFPALDQRRARYRREVALERREILPVDVGETRAVVAPWSIPALLLEVTPDPPLEKHLAGSRVRFRLQERDFVQRFSVEVPRC